ncbi:MAG: hypothetical protein K5761_06255 [Clostridiales bacterium]|nr:hypothetical protein [Clostridiales bacterium]
MDLFGKLFTKLTFIALILFVIGLVLAIISLSKYSRDKQELGEEMNKKPHIIRIAIVLVIFVLSQVCLILGRQ